jgi:AraC-like DNA-binding protein
MLAVQAGFCVAKAMAHSGSAAFTNPIDYQAGIGHVGVSACLILSDSAEFKARLTWLKQPHLRLLSSRESVPRIASISLVPTWAFVSFPVGSTTPLVCGGIELRSGDIMLHSRGERTHQWTNGPSKWGIVSVPHSQLSAFAKTLIGHDITVPPVAKVVRPPPSMGAHLRRLYLSACRVAETKPEILSHPEVVRAMEQELIHALVHCLTGDNISVVRKRDQTDVVLRFEDTLLECAGRWPSIAELCSGLGVTEPTLRACCKEMLGVSPSRYMYLRRLSANHAPTAPH